MSDFIIRKADARDASFLAEIIQIAARAHLPRSWFEIALDWPESECMKFLARLTDTAAASMWHHSRFLVGEVEGQPVAAMSAFRAADALTWSSAAIDEVATTFGLSADEQLRMWERGAYFFTCVQSVPEEDCWIIESVSTLPAFRQRGYTAALLSGALEIGRAHGLTTSRIRLFIDNHAALRVYERAGYTRVSEQCNSEFEAICGSPGLCQLVKFL